MPELPEVETIRRDLHAHLCGSTIHGLSVVHPGVVIGTPETFTDAVVGRRIVGSGRRGKVMWLDLEDGHAIAIHLRMSGQALLVDEGAPRPPHTHLIADLGGRRALLYVDPRRFGRLEIIDPCAPQASVLLRNIGPDALSADLCAETLCTAAAGRRIGIKQFLLDQRFISGIGNIYVAEILHRVPLDPATPAGRVTRAEMERILEQTHAVLGEAIAACGTTLADARYRSALGRSGEFACMLRVYGREGEPCRTEGCTARIQRRTSGGRSTYLCPACQRAGRRRRA